MDFLWPVVTIVAVIFMLDFIIERKKLYLYISIVSFIISLSLGIFGTIEFREIYLFLFFLSIALVILALRKELEFFTVLAIGLMIVMLLILFEYPLL